MKPIPNMGRNDRLIRIVLFAISLVLYFSDILSDTLGVIVLSLGVFLLLTTFTSICPLYSLLGISTRPVKDKAES